MRIPLAVAATLTTLAVAPAWAQAPSASELGLFVYPAKEQTKEQQAKDEQECYAWANEQSAIDPSAPKANSDSAAQAAQAKTDSATAGAAVGARRAGRRAAQ